MNVSDVADCQKGSIGFPTLLLLTVWENTEDFKGLDFLILLTGDFAVWGHKTPQDGDFYGVFVLVFIYLWGEGLV